MKRPDFSTQIQPPFSLHLPKRQTLPVVVVSAHSGSRYPTSFLTGCAVDRALLRRSEDWAVQKLAAAAPAFGAPLIAATFPRVLIDANREPYELDPAMFATALPDYVNAASPRVQVGLGTVHRYAADGSPIYRTPLEFAEVLLRIENYYLPFHAQLERLIRATMRRFGLCILIDCHSMPPTHPVQSRPLGSRGGGPAEFAVGDFVLGDLNGASCAAPVTDRAVSILARRGWEVHRNHPYAGAFITRHYGHPKRRVHALQVEINRALYMDEDRLAATAGFATVRNAISELIAGMGSFGLEMAKASAHSVRASTILDSADPRG